MCVCVPRACQVLFSRGERGGEMYLVVDGSVFVSNGEERCTLMLLPHIPLQLRRHVFCTQMEKSSLMLLAPSTSPTETYPSASPIAADASCGVGRVAEVTASFHLLLVSVSMNRHDTLAPFTRSSCPCL